MQSIVMICTDLLSGDAPEATASATVSDEATTAASHAPAAEAGGPAGPPQEAASKSGKEAAAVPPGKGGPTSEKPKGPPISDTVALQQLSIVGNGCCVVTLRCVLRHSTAACATLLVCHCYALNGS